jgi:6-pyruvoyltetrahydropterin/6-carboxytetrahydropterin synthase
MIMDFGFIKQLMMQEIHDPCDHGLILWKDDPHREQICDLQGRYGDGTTPWLKLYTMDAVPTAENLARHWHQRLSQAVFEFLLGDPLYQGGVVLDAVIVHETPNSVATYSPSIEQRLASLDPDMLAQAIKPIIGIG